MRITTLQAPYKSEYENSHTFQIYSEGKLLTSACVDFAAYDAAMRLLGDGLYHVRARSLVDGERTVFVFKVEGSVL